jgi:hypothetical protein
MSTAPYKSRKIRAELCLKLISTMAENSIPAHLLKTWDPVKPMGRTYSSVDCIIHDYIGSGEFILFFCVEKTRRFLH